MRDTFDYVVIGAGISGLCQAAVLAKEGKTVCLLEAGPIPGGYLQTFVRKKNRFDVGFHYIGSTNDDKPIGRYLRYLEVFDDIDFKYYPDDCFYRVLWDDKHFDLPSHFEVFIKKLMKTFPEDKEGILKYDALTKEITSALPWYHLKLDGVYKEEQGFGEKSIADWFHENFQNEDLKKMLGTFSFHVGLTPEKTPIISFITCMYSIFDRPVWPQNGGDGFIKPILKKAKEYGADVRFRSKVVKLNCEKRNVVSVVTEKGEEIYCSGVVSTIHPKLTLAMIDEKNLRPVFRRHINELRDSRGSFHLYILLKKELENIKPINYLCLFPKKNELTEGFYFHSPSKLNNEPDKPRITVCSFVDSMPFMKFQGSKLGKRSFEYEALKERYKNILLGELYKILPELEGNIESIYTSSPLTNLDYIGSTSGSALGISHDTLQQGIHRISPRTRIRNLLFSGQSVHLPGICGVIINAFYTASILLGHEYLFKKVAK